MIELPDDRITFLVITVLGFIVTWWILPSKSMKHGEVRWRGRPSPSSWRNRGYGTGGAAGGGGAEAVDEGFARRVLDNRAHARQPDREPWMLVLGVDRDVDARRLRSAYVSRMREIHPDSLGVAFGEQSAKSTECVDAYAMGREWLSRREAGSRPGQDD